MFNLKILHHNKMPFLHELEKAFEERFSNQLYQATVMADNTLSPLKLKSREWITYRMFSRWLLCGKVELIHGGHIKNFLFPEVDIEASNKWWTNGVLFYETEAPLTLIQDASIAMNNYIQYIFMTRRSPTGLQVMQLWRGNIYAFSTWHLRAGCSCVLCEYPAKNLGKLLSDFCHRLQC